MDNPAHEIIQKDKFRFVPPSEVPSATEAVSRSRGYFSDALRRFRKNKSSVVAAWIILFLVLFAVFSPIISGRKLSERDPVYTDHPPFVRAVADLRLGILDGAVIHDGQSEAQKLAWEAIGQETGLDPVIRVAGTTEHTEIFRGQERKVTYYRLQNNKYYERGVVLRVISPEEFLRIQAFQNNTGIQVLYPYVEPSAIGGIRDNPNIWYRVKDAKGTPLTDADGHLIPAYSTSADRAGSIPYMSLRVAGDSGDCIYSYEKSGALEVRVCYYNYYRYQNGREPNYVLGTNSMGECIFTAIGVGARFSLVFALVVSAINLTVGAVFGAVQGYYGGALDLLMDRVADILSGVPFIVVATLFQLHLAVRVGIVPSLLFAFVLTGWIGTAALTRKQFYRYKSREFVLAAKTLGASDRRLMFRHIFPNSLGTIITASVLTIPGVISSEATMTYLGIVNIQEAFGTSIGYQLSQASQGAKLMSAPHSVLYPALFISLLLISFNLMGNGLRDAFDPSTRGGDD